MTGFGQAQRESARLRVTASLRCVNHRQLDLVIRLPEEVRGLEPQVRDRLRRELHRGRVEAKVEVAFLEQRACRAELSLAAVEALRKAAGDLSAAGLARGELEFADLARFPEVVRLVVEPPAWGDDETALLLTAVEAALDQAVAARRQEGERLRVTLDGRLDELAALLEEIDGRRPEARRQLEERFRQRLAEVAAMPAIDEDRLAQEVALLIERTDVQEELDRLVAHVGHARGLLDDSGPIGRRLDFLCQEILREVNTLGAKSRDLPLARLVLDAKSVCEQLREQIQNLE